MFGNEFSFPKSKNLVFCECSEVGLIGKLDVQKGGVFGLNNQSSDRHKYITTQIYRYTLAFVHLPSADESFDKCPR